MRCNRNARVVVLTIIAFVVASPGALHARDWGHNQPGALGNPRMDPGLNQPGAVGKAGTARRSVRRW
jgi:hypothetical protein